MDWTRIFIGLLIASACGFFFGIAGASASVFTTLIYEILTWLIDQDDDYDDDYDDDDLIGV